MKYKIIKPKNLDRYLKTLEARGKAFKRVVTKKAAEVLKDKIQERATSKKQDYAEHIKLKKIAGKNNALVILVDEISKTLEETKETSVIDYQAVSRAFMSSAVYSVLKKFGPYPAKYLPFKLDRRYVRLAYRTVTEKEYISIRAKAASSFDDIQKKLLKAGATVGQLSAIGAIPPETQVIEDLVFRTIRREFGERTRKVPVWIPSLKEFLAGQLLFLDDPDLKKIMTVPSYTGYPNLGLIVKAEKEAIEKRLNKFQEKIFSRL